MASVFRPGDRCGPYEIVRQLGEGGMGEVHLARTAGGEARALKVLSPNAQQNRELAKRFMGEIQVLSYLEHAHVVRFFDTGTLERDGRSVLWLALEFLQGKTLREVVQTHPGAVPEDTLIRWGRQIAQGVHEAHKLKVIHRDLKPENVIIVGDDMAKVIDFGIAKFRDWGDTRSRTSGAKIGTILYMAPEQLDDALGIPIDERTDVYGLGLILYELVLGRNPYVDQDGSLDMASLMVRKLAQDLPPIGRVAPHLSPELGTIIDRACQHDAARRFPNMGELHDALGAVWRQRMDARRAHMLGEPLAARPAAPPRAESNASSGPAWLAPPAGQSSRFESVRTLPGRDSPLARARSLRDVALLGAALGVASGLVAYRAVIEPRLTRSAAVLPEGPTGPKVAGTNTAREAPPAVEVAPSAEVVANTTPSAAEAPTADATASTRPAVPSSTPARRTAAANPRADSAPAATSPVGAATPPPASLAPPSSVLIHQNPRPNTR